MTPQQFVRKRQRATLTDWQAAMAAGPHDAPLLQGTARAVHELRDSWLNPKGVTETVLEKCTLTNLYSQRPEWLHLAHLKLDRAVLDAYGWQDINAKDLTATHRPNPGETKEQAATRQRVAEEDMLKRLLELNHERAG
jgi:hypothetical protein